MAPVIKDSVQLTIVAYLLYIGEWPYALGLFCLILPQVYFAKTLFIENPIENDVKYQGSSLPFFSIGTIVAASAIGNNPFHWRAPRFSRSANAPCRRWTKKCSCHDDHHISQIRPPNLQVTTWTPWAQLTCWFLEAQFGIGSILRLVNIVTTRFVRCKQGGRTQNVSYSFDPLGKKPRGTARPPPRYQNKHARTYILREVESP